MSKGLKMPKGLNSLSFLAAVKHLQTKLPLRIRKVFSSGRKFAFELDSKDYLVSASGYLFLSRLKPTTLSAQGFTMQLRKHLENRPVEEIKQIGGDRIVALNSGSLSLIIETFDGNIILTDQNKILGALEQRKWRSRSILPNEEYCPPAPSLPLEDLRLETFQKLFGRKECVKVLAADLGLGKTLSEYFLRSTSIPKETLLLSREQADSLLSKIFHSIQRIEENKGYLYGTEVLPIKLDTEPDESFATFFDSVEASLNLEEKNSALFLHAKQAEDRLKPFSKALERQKSARQQLFLEADLEKKKAEAIYENFPKVEQLLELFKREGWEAIIRHPLVKEARPDEGKIVIDL